MFCAFDTLMDAPLPEMIFQSIKMTRLINNYIVISTDRGIVISTDRGIVISTDRGIVISTERSEWRNLQSQVRPALPNLPCP